MPGGAAGGGQGVSAGPRLWGGGWGSGGCGARGVGSSRCAVQCLNKAIAGVTGKPLRASESSRQGS